MSSMIFSRLVVATHLQGRRGLCGDWRDLGVTGGVRLSQDLKGFGDGTSMWSLM